MNESLPPDDYSPEDLPLRHRRSRARDAEIIRQEFVQCRKQLLTQEGDSSANQSTRDEQ